MSVENPSTALERLVDRIARWLLAKRKVLTIVFALITLALGASALRVQFDPGFNKLIPLKHPYMSAFLKYSSVFAGANRVLISVQWKGDGDIYNPEFMKTLRGVTDDVFFTPGVNRAQVFSLFTPNVKYIEVTEEGFAGDVVIPSRFVADEAGLAQVRANVARSGEIGRLVANDLKSALVRADLLEVDPSTGKKLDYAEVSKKLEQIRAKYSNDKTSIQIVGFAKVVGDVMDGLFSVMTFFAVAFVVTALLLIAYTRSMKLSLVALAVALLPVIWLLGILPLLGLGIDPMSILVPFLIFSIGVSHAVQMTNAWRQDVLAGHSPDHASYTAFCNLAVPGTLALLTNALGFMVIMLIDIPIVHELGITACLGVLLMIGTNKMFLPLMLTHLKLEPQARADGGGTRNPLWWAVSAFATPKVALATIGVWLALLAIGTVESRHLLTGDVGTGVPELRPDSLYNRDNDKIVKSYSIGMDILSVYVETSGFGEDDACLKWPVMDAVERFDLYMRGVSGVQSVVTVATIAKVAAGGNNEGNPRWEALQRSEGALRTGSRSLNPDQGLNDDGCKTINLMVYLKDHEGSTLHHVVGEVQKFIATEKTPGVKFRLGGGNAGVAAATNEAVEQAERQMLGAIFGAITILCWLTFRTWKAVLCIIVPLTIVSILCNALMAWLGIGLKVPTLPVIALGVGVGVDYGIYLFERMQHEIEEKGSDLRTAFYEAMRQRGTAAVFTAITMAVGVGTWAFAALKFQADMGVLLAFMFLVNVFGAIFLLPAMACWLNVGGTQKGAAKAGA